MIIDRIEGDKAILELQDGTFEPISCKLLPKEAKEGDLVIITVAKEQTEQRRCKIEKKMKGLFRDTPPK